MLLRKRIYLAADGLRPHRKPPGTQPGLLVYEGKQPERPVRLQSYDFGADHLDERVLDDAAETATFRHAATTTRINVDGVHDVELVE